jgi:hypothetical protein
MSQHQDLFENAGGFTLSMSHNGGPRLDASVLLAELPIYKQEAQALIWLSYSVLGVRRDFDLRVESRRGRSYGTPRVTGREGLPELRIPRPQSEKPVRQKNFGLKDRAVVSSKLLFWRRRMRPPERLNDLARKTAENSVVQPRLRP